MTSCLKAKDEQNFFEKIAEVGFGRLWEVLVEITMAYLAKDFSFLLVEFGLDNIFQKDVGKEINYQMKVISSKVILQLST